MRINQPISQREYDFGSDATLMSTTDTQSRITYCNAAFLEVSGFDKDELMSQPHNIVRHPDMPPEIFADLYATLKAGEPWTSLVKNRRKNGDHYWVRANVTPIRRNGRITGYMSVRTKPTRQEVQEAQALHEALRKGKTGLHRFHKGLVVRSGLLAWTSALQVMPVRWRIRCALGVATLGAVGAAAGFGLTGAALAGFAGSVGALGLVAAIWLQSQVATPLAGVLRQALAVAAGQPADNINFDRVDEIGLIMRALNQAGLNLRSLVDDVSQQVAGLESASSEIAQGNNDLSSRTEQAASSLMATSASMEEMIASVNQNADGARQATQLAGDASKAAVQGGEMVGQVVGTMLQITTSSKKISDIIGVIDGIAFQTNILALNAAVEAARAGEQGRGFAVVASEVRSLAKRSADAAKEIKTLINASVETVESGSRQVGAAGRSMGNIVAQVQRVSDLIQEISAATTDQSHGISQVNAAVTQLDRMTQQNAALVEESTAAAVSMKGQAHRLAEAVNVYKAVN
jgi:aerotaxis receptor